MGSRAYSSNRRGAARYGPDAAVGARFPQEWQFERRRANPETDAYDSYFRGDARVHAMAPPYEDDYGVKNVRHHPADKRPLPRRRPARRTSGLGDMESPRESGGYSMADLFFRDDVIYDAFHSSKGGRPKGPWSGMFSSLFGCVPGRRPSGTRKLVERRARELLELSRRQESALADKQDTIDILQWKLQQLQLFGQEHERWMMGAKRFTPTRAARDSPLGGGVPEKGSYESLSGYLAGLKLVDNDQLAVLVLFDTAVTRSRIAVRCFCRIFMKQMEASGYVQVWKALSDMEPRTTFARKEHSAFVLEAHINRALFHSFENESFDDAGITKIIDPQERCSARLAEYEMLKSVDAVDAVNGQHSLFDPDFLRFCDGKMREMWFLFPWNIVFQNADQRAVFTGSFLDAAKNVWLLHRLAHAANPVCSILRVGRGTTIDGRYVEVVAIPPYETCRKCVKPRVEFMTMPGFRAQQRVTKCQVYQHFTCR